MQVRFQGRLDVDLQVDDDVMDALVPNFVLQPLVENAVMHGVAKVEGSGRIELRARRVGDDRRDHAFATTARASTPRSRPTATGASRGRAAETGGTGGVGLSNTRARLEQLYGADQRLSLRRRASAAPWPRSCCRITRRRPPRRSCTGDRLTPHGRPPADPRAHRRRRAAGAPASRGPAATPRTGVEIVAQRGQRRRRRSRRFASLHPDIVFLDVQMPGKTGSTSCARSAPSDAARRSS